MNDTGLLLSACGGSLAAIALWFGLCRAERVSPRRLFVVILGVGLISRIAFALFTPAFHAPDEQAHFKYVKYLAEHRSLPVQTSRTDSPTNDWEYYQPPLYYLSLAPFYRLSDELFHDDLVTVRLLRAFSILLWGVTVWFAFGFLERMRVVDVFVRVFVIGMISLLPSYVFLSSVINNDNLLLAIGAGVLYLVAQPSSPRRSVLMGLLLGAGLLTKLTAVVYVILIVAALLVGLVRRTAGRAGLGHVILTGLIAGLLWTPWACRNWSVYGSITAENVANVAMQWETGSQAVTVTLHYLQASFWAAAGTYNNIQGVYPLIGMHVFYFACLGLLYGRLSAKERLLFHLRNNSDLLIASALAILVNAVLAFRFGILYGQGQGRFLFPMLIPLSLFMGTGLRMFPVSDSEKSPRHLAGFLITYAVSFECFSLAALAGT